MLVELLKRYWFYLALIVVGFILLLDNFRLKDELSTLKLSESTASVQGMEASQNLYFDYKDKSVLLGKEYEDTKLEAENELISNIDNYLAGHIGLRYKTETTNMADKGKVNLSKAEPVCDAVLLPIPLPMGQDIFRLRESIKRDIATIKQLQGDIKNLEAQIAEFNELKGY